MDLTKTADRLRRDIIEMVYRSKAGHVGGDLSVIDILTVLYFKEMNVSPQNWDSPDRDRFLLSKGHCVDALYAVLGEKGFFDKKEAIETFSAYGSKYIGHPNTDVPGIEINSGSLGHGLAIGTGMALAAKMNGQGYRTYVVLGDGEMAEGSNYEAMMAAAHYHLDNLCATVDLNGLQISGTTAEVMNSKDLGEKFAAFGWNVIKTDGNDCAALSDAYDQAAAYKGKPSVLIAHTIKGRGVSFMENQKSWHHGVLTQAQYEFLTDYSNASRTQLFDIHRLQWDEKMCSIFGIDVKNLPNVCNSDADFGQTSLGGYLEQPIPIHCVMGDSHGALFGQGCLEAGMVKATYGTGSSVMMNIGEKPVISSHGVVTSIAWGMKDGVNYVLEGNLNYTGAVITWLKDDMEMIQTPEESELLAYKAAADDSLYLVPAFSGLGAPYWNSSAQAAAVGMTRTTWRAEFVRAGLECIAYQITDIIKAMEQDAGMKVRQLRVDGGPTTANGYLMQFQSNILDAKIQVPDLKELSAVGVSYAAGMAAGLYDAGILEKLRRKEYAPCMPDEERTKKYQGWINAVGKIL